MKLHEELSATIAASVPLSHVRTQDAPATQTTIVRAISDVADTPMAIYCYSALLGVEPLNEAASQDLGALTGGQDPSMLADPATLLQAIAGLSSGGDVQRVVIWWGADRAWSDGGLATVLLLMRDRLTMRSVQLVGLGAGDVGGLLASHVHPMVDDLPDDADREGLIQSLLDGQDDPPIYSASDMSATVNATRGLHGFAVEQIAALASEGGRLDPVIAGKRWRSMLGQLPGVRVLEPWPVSWYGGNAAWIREIHEYAEAKPSLVCVLDELEKVISRPGQAQDSGASDAITGSVLEFLNGSQSHEVCGAICEGVPGMGKTMSGQIAGSILQCPVLLFNPARLKAGIVGETERQAEQVFSTLRAFGGLQLWIGTSNNLSTVPEELCDRFPSGVWFFDLPTLEERRQIWAGQLARYGFQPSQAGQLAELEGFTGRDVRATCLESKRKRLPVADVARRRIPASQKMATRIDAMRRDAAAAGYRSASTGQVYAGPIAPLERTTGATRAIGRRATPTPPTPPTPPTTGGTELF